MGQNGLSCREEAQSSIPCASHTHPVPSVCHHSTQGPAAGTSCIRDEAWSKCHILFQGHSVSSHQTQPMLAPSLVTGEQRVWQGTQGSHTRAALLSRTIPPVEQFRISPFHQHQVIQFHFCTSWVYLARREAWSLLSSCLVAQSVTLDPSLPLPELLLSPSSMWSRATRQVPVPPHTLLSSSRGSLPSDPPAGGLWGWAWAPVLCFLWLPDLNARLCSGMNRATSSDSSTEHAPNRKGGPGMMLLCRERER